jgi:alkanesulfonate monooxygenase SsuD/methylene tetrahydromethanopterin reductase-like flavin-dependent oxidoreductase (luciferase family)
MIKSWAFEFFPKPPESDEPYDPVKYFTFYLDLWARAEAWGYEGVFLSEHHFGTSYMPSPNILLPLIAERTKTLRLGVMGMVIPYHNPWRLAEEIGMLDHLTGGRLEVGASVGIPDELIKVGLSAAEARARFDEAMKVIDAALMGEPVTYKGEYWNFDNLSLSPKPIQKPSPPKWTTVISAESARKAARRGSKISTGFLSTDKVKEVFDAYNEEADKARMPSGPEQLALRRQIVIDTDGAAAAQRMNTLATFVKGAAATFDRRIVTRDHVALDQPGAHTFALGDEEFFGGSPALIAEEVIRQCTETGAGHFLAVFADARTKENAARAWELFGTEVVPLLKRA